MNSEDGGTRHLRTLLEVSRAVSETVDLKGSLCRVLEILGQHHDVTQSAVALLSEGAGRLRIEASNGPGADDEPARHLFAEGITARVVQSGKPIAVPQVSREPMFLNHAGQKKNLDKQELSFICAPVIVNRKPAGALSVGLRFREDRDYERQLEFFRIVAWMIAQAVKADRFLASEGRQLRGNYTHLSEELRERYDFSNVIGKSGPMRRVYEQVAQVAGANTTVLIRGESGTGKGLIAHAIHYNSPRASRPLVKVSCAALPDTLIESELFGYERGAFTGAQGRKKGRFEMAEGGTLFLDEIGDLNPSTQVKLLRVLQEREFERLGGTETLHVNVRLIAATNKDLEKSIAAGAFREDLYYRLNVFAIFIPPLRERKSDVVLLADHFLEQYSAEHGKKIKRISTAAIDVLMRHNWPGNVRELENVIERAVLVCEGDVIHGHHLPASLQAAEASGTALSISLATAVEAYEKNLIQEALNTTRGNRARAAKLLNSTKRIVTYKVKKYAIDCDRFRS